MKYVLILTLLAFTATAADAALVHKCRYPDGSWHAGACPTVLNGNRVNINCHGWKSPHRYRHGGHCTTAG